MVGEAIVKSEAMRTDIRLVFPRFQNDGAVFADEFADEADFVRIVHNVLGKIDADFAFFLGREILRSQRQVGFADSEFSRKREIALITRELNQFAHEKPPCCPKIRHFGTFFSNSQPFIFN